MCCRAVTMGSVISICLIFVGHYVRLFHVFVRWVVWYSGLLWLVVFAVVSRCDLITPRHYSKNYQPQ